MLLKWDVLLGLHLCLESHNLLVARLVVYPDYIDRIEGLYNLIGLASYVALNQHRVTILHHLGQLGKVC